MQGGSLEFIVPLELIEYGIYGDLIITYPKPYSIYLRGTIGFGVEKLCHSASVWGFGFGGPGLAVALEVTTLVRPTGIIIVATSNTCNNSKKMHTAPQTQAESLEARHNKTVFRSAHTPQKKKNFRAPVDRNYHSNRVRWYPSFRAIPKNAASPKRQKKKKRPR